MSSPRAQLEEIVARLRPILGPAGFKFEFSDEGVSSGGSFAAGFFSRRSVRIGLIVRGEALGLPNYDWEDMISGHDDLVRALGRQDEALLQWNDAEWKLVTAGGVSVVEALASDLTKIIIPSLAADADVFRRAVEAVDAERQRRLSGGAS